MSDKIKIDPLETAIYYAQSVIDAQADVEAPNLRAILLQAPAELKRLRQIEQEHNDTLEMYRRVMAEQCAPDEQHCSCVPALRTEIERLRQIEQAINEILDETECAYPLDMFPEPDYAVSVVVKGQYPGFIDCVSAKMGRHLAGVIRRKLAAALEAK